MINVLQWLVASRPPVSNTLWNRNQYSDLQVTKIVWHFTRNKIPQRARDRTGVEQSQGAKASLFSAQVFQMNFVKYFLSSLYLAISATAVFSLPSFHGFTEPQNSLGWKEHSSPSSCSVLPWAGLPPTRSCCPGPHPTQP